MNTLLKTTLITLVFCLNTLHAEVRQADTLNGAQVWSDVCMRCHNLRQPADLSSRAWKFSMNHMRIRAGLTADETQDIQAFILQSKSAVDGK